MSLILWILVAGIFSVSDAYAYVSPGLGMGAFSMVIGVVGAIALALVSILYYPIKRLLRAGRNAKAVDNDRAS